MRSMKPFTRDGHVCIARAAGPLVAVALLVSVAFAQPPTLERPATAGDAAAEERPREDRGPAPEPDRVKESGESELDTELLRRLLRERPGEAAPGDNPLERAIQGMRSAHERIAGRDTSAGTREIQQQVIDDLARLVELAKQPPPSQNNSSQQPSPSPQNSEPQPQPEPQPDQQPDPRDGQPQPQDQESDAARESSERERERAARAAELNRRRTLVDGVWGHLPPSIRNKILSGSDEEYLQDYEHLARRYFEALAEEGARAR